MQLKLRILEVIQTNTFHQSILTISATIISGVLGLLFYMLVARNLGPGALGIFAVSVAVLSLVADIGDLGTDTGLIRFIGKYSEDMKMQLGLLKLSMEVKILVWFVVLVVGWFVAPIIASLIFHKVDLTEPLRIAFIGVGGALFLSFTSHGLQAFQKYKIWAVILVTSNLVRLVIISILVLTVGLNIQNTLFTYISIPLLFFVVSLFFLPKFFRIKGELGVVREFFKFNRWIFLLSIVAAFNSRVDTFLITRLLSIDQVGIYSAANQLTSFVPQLSFAIATVAAPKLARFSSKKDVLSYFKKLQLFVFGLCFVGLLGIPIGYYIIQNLYGFSYQGAFLPFIVLYLSQLVFLISLPTHQSIFYYFAKPKVFVPICIIQLLIVTMSGWWLINSFGILGASLAVLLGNLFLFIAPALWVTYQFKK